MRAVAELGDRLHRRLRVKLPDSLPKAYGDRSSLDTVVRADVAVATYQPASEEE